MKPTSILCCPEKSDHVPPVLGKSWNSGFVPHLADGNPRRTWI
jgi:hypothetical protein